MVSNLGHLSKFSLLYQKFDHCTVEKSGLHQPLLKTFLVSKLANLCDNFRQKHSICIQFSKHHGACLMAAAARVANVVAIHNDLLTQ